MLSVAVCRVHDRCDAAGDEREVAKGLKPISSLFLDLLNEQVASQQREADVMLLRPLLPRLLLVLRSLLAAAAEA